MFFRCSSLKSLPDISKFNTNKIWNISGIFGECNLIEIPDISKWFLNIEKAILYGEIEKKRWNIKTQKVL